MTATDNLLTNNSRVNLATSYIVDKIVGIFSDSFNAATDTTTPAVGYRLYKFAHSFSRPVFCELLFSTDGGATYSDGGLGPAIAYSDSNYIYILTVQTSGTCNYKIVCTWIDDYDATNPSIAPQLTTTNTAYFDSRQNYPKVYLQGMITATAKLPSENISTITHSLGYIPNFKVYFESLSGQVWPQIYGGTNDAWKYTSTQSEAFGVANSSQLKLDCLIPATGSDTRVWYKIYLDQ